MTTTFAAVHRAQAESLSIPKSEISVPWRLLAIGICLFGSADIVAMEGMSAGATATFLGAYTSFAASLTMFLTKAGR
jgi:hypothetical protein